MNSSRTVLLRFLTAPTQTQTHTHTNAFNTISNFYVTQPRGAPLNGHNAHKSKAMLSYISLSHNAMFLTGQYEWHGRKIMQQETSWRSSSEHLELTRRKRSERLSKLRQTAVAQGINQQAQQKKSVYLLVLYPASIRRPSVFQLAIHRNGSNGLEHQFNNRLVTLPFYYSHNTYSKAGMCLYESSLRNCVKNQCLRN